MWKILVNIGMDYVRRHLLPRIHVNPVLTGLFDRLLIIAGMAVDRITDSDPNNKAQLEQLWRDNVEEIISAVLAGGITAIRDAGTKERVICILQDAAAQLEKQPVVA